MLVRVDGARVTGRGSDLRPGGAGAGDRRRRLARRTARQPGAARPGGCAPADGADLAAVLVGARAARGGRAARTSGGGRRRGAGRRSASRSAHRPADQRALVPALVDGDDAGLDPELAEDFRTTGLTHLLAVSGTNLTLVVGFLLVLARWCGVRGRWLLRRRRGRHRRVRAAGPHRAERAAGRGDGHGRAGRRWAPTAGSGAPGRSGVAVVVLLLVDPGLAVSVGLRAVGAGHRRHPAARAGLARRPGAVAAAVAGRGGRGAGRGPAGLHAGGRRASPARSAWSRWPPTCSSRRRSGRPPCSGSAGGLRRAGLAARLGRLLGTRRRLVRRLDRRGRRPRAPPCRRRRWAGAPGCCRSSLLTVLWSSRSRWRRRALLRRPATGARLLRAARGRRAGAAARPRAGRRTAGCWWRATSARATRSCCDAGPDAAVVVDAGPDPAAVDGCLDRLGIDAGAAGGAHPLPRRPRRRAGRGARRPAGRGGRDHPLRTRRRRARRSATVGRGRAGAGPRRRTATTARSATSPCRCSGRRRTSPDDGPGDGSAANDASVVLLVEVRGVRMLLTGDMEPAGPGRAGAAPARAAASTC